MGAAATYRVRVEWGDCDAAEIVFYPNYLRWFDAAAHNLLRTLGAESPQLVERHRVVALPLLEVHVAFKQPSRAGDELLIETRIASWERKTFRLQHSIVNGGEVAVEGLETRAWCVRHPDEPDRLRAAVIPEEVLALFAG